MQQQTNKESARKWSLLFLTNQNPTIYVMLHLRLSKRLPFTQEYTQPAVIFLQLNDFVDEHAKRPFQSH